MNKKTKLWLGIGFVAAAIYLVYAKSKQPKAPTDPVCKADEHLMDAPCPKCSVAPCPCPKTKVCMKNSAMIPQVLNMGVPNEEIESFTGFAGY